MNKKNAILLVLATSFSISAQAAVNWSFTSGGTNSSSSYGNIRTFSADSIEVKATAWSDSGSSNVIDSAYLGRWSGGLGVANKTEGLNAPSPDHALDNKTGTDGILLSFSDVVALTSLQLGWLEWEWKNDANAINHQANNEVSILAYTGNAPFTGIVGKSYSSLLSSGWELVSTNNQWFNSTKTSINFGNLSSSQWLITGYNPVFNGKNSDYHEFVKLAAVSGVKVDKPVPPTGQVSEPASLALAGLALFGLMGLRRRGS